RLSEVAVRSGVVELQGEGLTGRGRLHLFGREAGEDVGLVVTGEAVERGEGAAGVVLLTLCARFPAAGVGEWTGGRAVVVQRVAVVVMVGVGVEDRVPGAPARGYRFAVVERFVAVAVEELADVDGPVAGLLKPHREVVRVGLADRETG